MLQRENGVEWKAHTLQQLLNLLLGNGVDGALYGSLWRCVREHERMRFVANEASDDCE